MTVDKCGRNLHTWMNRSGGATMKWPQIVLDVELMRESMITYSQLAGVVSHTRLQRIVVVLTISRHKQIT